MGIRKRGTVTDQLWVLDLAFFRREVDMPAAACWWGGPGVDSVPFQLGIRIFSTNDLADPDSVALIDNDNLATAHQSAPD